MLTSSLTLFSLITVSSKWIKIGFNNSESLPGSIFLVIKNGEINRGDLVAFYPPKNPNYKTWFVKYLVGLPGDKVREYNRDFFINDRFIGRAKEYSKQGIKLEKTTSRVIEKGFFFMWTPHKDSYDSRYQDIGLIPSDRVIGRAIRIF